MAEYCLKCYNKLENKNYTKDDVVLSSYPETCEGCGQIKYTVVKVRNKKRTNRILIGVIIANIILWTTLIALLWEPKQSELPETPGQKAYIAAKYLMKNYALKVPDDAEFAPFEETTIFVDDNYTYAVNMWIQAQNSIGVKVKNNYEILVRYEPEQGQWRLLSWSEK